MTCWRKFHEFYLPRGLYNKNGRIRRSSELHIARLAVDRNQLSQEYRDLCAAPNYSLERPDPSDVQSTAAQSMIRQSSPPLSSSSRQSYSRALNMDDASDVSLVDTATPPVESFTTLLSRVSPRDTSAFTSPPTLVMPPFNGALANAFMEMEMQADRDREEAQPQASPYPTPATPGMFVEPQSESSSSETVSVISHVTRSSTSMDFVP